MIEIIEERLRELYNQSGVSQALAMGDLSTIAVLNELRSLRGRIKEKERERLHSLTEAQIDRKRQSPKTLYHTFPMGERVVIVCVLSDSNVRVGYSIKCPGDTFNRELGKKIALGRARKKPLAISVITDYSRDKNVLQAIAKHWEKEIRKGKIRGIK